MKSSEEMNLLTKIALSILVCFTKSLPQSSAPSLEQRKECSDFESAGYYCVPYYQCSKNGSIILDGSDIFDPRTAEDGNKVDCPDHEETLQTGCNELLELCCLHPIKNATRVCESTSKRKCDYDYIDYEDYEDCDYPQPPTDTGGCTNEDIVFDIRTDKDCNKTVKCEDYKDKGYSCVPYFQCLGKGDSNKTISDGFGIIDLRSDISSDCVSPDSAKSALTLDASDDKCPGDNQVCCKNPNTNVQLCPPTHGNEDKWSSCGRIKFGEKRDSRGVTITNLNSKVTRPAQPGEFPHMCIVYKKNNGVTTYLGGASLLARNKVLSVAHKFHVITRRETVDLRPHIENLSVRCGEYNVKLETELLRAQESAVAELYFHPLYDPANQFVPNDLVIIRTRENFIYQEHIGPVCLPRPGEKFEDPTDECWSSGWGADQFGSVGKFQDILKKVGMNVIPDDECNQRLSSTRLRNKYRVEQSHLCVGGEKNIDTCTGDGGSPHVCNRGGKWIQIGAVAWGIGCNDGIPAIYSSVSDAMCWIDWVMTCYPLATNDISLNQDPQSERSADGPQNSVNKLTQQDCGDWAAANPGLTRQCRVVYEEEQNVDEYDYDVRITDEYDYDVRITE